MILVVGATGVVGGMIVRQLLEEDKVVRILVRRDSPSSQLVQQGLATSAEELIKAGAQPVYGDLRDRASLDVAVEGVETVITTANAAMRGGTDNPQSVDLEGNRNVIEAARDAGVEHFIFVSLLGADPNTLRPSSKRRHKANQPYERAGWSTRSLPQQRSWKSGQRWWWACPSCKADRLPWSERAVAATASSPTAMSPRSLYRR
jgi:uncharacterized protein YbjT (DUF2867 family)